MDRRVTLQKHREVSEIFVPSSAGCISPPTVQQTFTSGGPLLLAPLGPSIIECDSETITIPLDSIENSVHNVDTVLNNNSETITETDTQNNATPRFWDITKRRRRRESVNVLSGTTSRRKRLASWTSSVNSDVLSHDGRNSVTKETSGEHKRTQKKLRTKGLNIFQLKIYYDLFCDIFIVFIK